MNIELINSIVGVGIFTILLIVFINRIYRSFRHVRDNTTNLKEYNNDLFEENIELLEQNKKLKQKLKKRN